MTDEKNLDFRARRNFQRVLLAGAIVSFLVIVMGGVVRATGSFDACQGWPTCDGRWLPPLDPAAWVEYIHRLSSLALAPLLVWAAVLSWKRARGNRLVSTSVYGALGLIAVQVGLGAALALRAPAGDTRWPTALHLGLSLLVLALMVVALVAVSYWQKSPAPKRMAFRSPFARLTAIVFGAVFVLLLSGALVSGSGAGEACSGWPLCGVSLATASPQAWVNLFHRLLVALTAVLVGIDFVQAWRTQRSQPPVLAAVSAAAVLFFSQSLMGAVSVWQGFPAYMIWLHEATAVAVWGAMAVALVAVGMAARSGAEERIEAQAFAARRPGQMARDLLMLTKPIVVLLLLVTTFAGMVIGARAWPSLSLVFWTLLGGFMASGGSGAINQYIDRSDDGKMQRTEKRPIPSGRLEPAEGLAFGILLTVSSFFLMVVFVNLLAALLSLAGIIYYVLIYSIMLKKASVNNIVIGGGAGAIPPLVGWAAATGSLNFPSLLLFAVIFMWTPPHFWALAIVRARDYARAGVPMLPVVRGEKEARTQIMIYTIELVILTLALPIFGLGGAVYLVSAVLLGVMLLYSAWQVLKIEGNKVAWKMYRYSSMYLAFLFLALMVDRLM